jgi:hypothetical protein
MVRLENTSGDNLVQGQGIYDALDMLKLQLFDLAA